MRLSLCHLRHTCTGVTQIPFRFVEKTFFSGFKHSINRKTIGCVSTKFAQINHCILRVRGRFSYWKGFFELPQKFRIGMLLKDGIVKGFCGGASYNSHRVEDGGRERAGRESSCYIMGPQNLIRFSRSLLIFFLCCCEKKIHKILNLLIIFNIQFCVSGRVCCCPAHVDHTSTL